jgi:hypothetical protein
VTAPITGMKTSPTSESMILPNAAPMITPIARSTTLPRRANFLNSSSMATSVAIGADASSGARTGAGRRGMETPLSPAE